MRRVFKGAAASLTLVSASAAAGAPPADWDGLVRVQSKRADLIYLQPGADFKAYTKVLMEPVEVAFHKDWARDYNSSTRSLSSRVSDRDVEDALARGIKAANDIFSEAWTKGGYALVDAPGPDVVRVKVGIVNIRVSAPERVTSSRSYSFANEAGSATLFVEARDSTTGALLGRVVDQQIAGDNLTAWRTSVSNRSDFRMLAEKWAADSVRGFGALKTRSPITP